MAMAHFTLFYLLNLIFHILEKVKLDRIAAQVKDSDVEGLNEMGSIYT